MRMFFRAEFKKRLRSLCDDGSVLEFSGKRPGTPPSQILSTMTAHGRVVHLVELDSGYGLIVCEDPTAAERILESSPLLVDTSTIHLSRTE